MATIGLNYVFKIVRIDDVNIKLQIWDTAGQDKFKTITKNYYRNTQGVLVVFGIDCRDSFYSVCKSTLIQNSGWKIYLRLRVRRLAFCWLEIKRILRARERWVLRRQMRWLILTGWGTCNVVLKLGRALNKFFCYWVSRWKTSFWIVMIFRRRKIKIVRLRFILIYLNRSVAKNDVLVRMMVFTLYFIIHSVSSLFIREHLKIFILHNNTYLEMCANLSKQQQNQPSSSSSFTPK